MRRQLSLLFLALCVACVEAYVPSVNLNSLTALVVDGYIASNGTASVKLSHSIPTTAKDYFPLERNATVTIQSSSGKIFSLQEGDSAVYAASNLPLSNNETYTLHIKTSKGDEYRSDEIRILPSPAIDDVFFTVSSSGNEIEVRLDAADTNPDATGFYLWDCIETYEYHAPFYAGWKLVNHQPVERQPDEVLYTCWRDVKKPSVIYSTNALVRNVISQQVVSVIPKGSDKLTVRYSVLIRQRAISEGEYNFRKQLQNTTEQTGSIFSVIPGSVVSNVHSVNNEEEYVLGYFHGKDVVERRFFIDRTELPESFRVPIDKKNCEIYETCPVGGGGFNCIPVEQLSDNALITSANTNESGVILNYNYTISACGDCTYQGGTTTKPSFWK